MKRRDFVAIGGAAATLGAAPARRVAQAPATPAPDATPTPFGGPRLQAALVLSGGGARGAYEAGVIDALAEVHGLRDGQPLPYDLVCGASIGALNAWFVATAQYSAMRSAWHSIASEELLRIKPRYYAVARESSGVFTRIYQALLLARGLVSNVRGVLDDAPLRSWVHRHIDPDVKLVTPVIFTVTNLTLERGELFYRLPFDADPEIERQKRAALATIVGPNVIARYAHDHILQDALRASASIPVLFDPVRRSFDDGKPSDYVDGGVANNTPVDVARAFARNIYTVFVDATDATSNYESALAIGLGSFTIMQNLILNSAVRQAYIASLAKRSFRPLSNEAVAALGPADREDYENQRKLIARTFDTELFEMRPQTDLPVSFAGFDDQAGMDAAYVRGQVDGRQGFSAYRYPFDSPGFAPGL